MRNRARGKAYTSVTTCTSASTSKAVHASSSTSPSTSTSTSVSASNDDMPELEHDDIEIEDLSCPTLSPLKKQVDRATQTETIKVDVQVQTNYNMAFKVYT